MKRHFSWLLTLSIALMLTACDSPESRLPSELKLTTKTYDSVVSHAFGPGGINHSVRIYELPTDVIEEISKSGLGYLNNLPSTHHYQHNKYQKQINPNTEVHWKPFLVWHETPVVVDDKWVRRSYLEMNREVPTLSLFIGEFENKSKFLDSLPADIKMLIYQMLVSKGNYYAYGGYREKCVLVLSPSEKKALYLFRD